MKKIISLLLLVVMLLSLSLPALAYDEEITWLGIPWGSSPEEALPILAEKGVIKEEILQYRKLNNSNCSFLFPSEEIWDGPFAPKHFDAKACKWYLSKSDILSQIAGYDVNNISLNYSDDGEQQNLLTIRITFDTTQQKEAFEDLSQKLMKVYGECESTVYNPIPAMDIRTNTWYGENNTVVCLIYIYSSTTLFYSVTNAKEILDQIPDPDVTVDANDTFGL